MLRVKPLKLSMDTHLKLCANRGDPLPDPTPYQQLLGKLIFLIVTRTDISFTVHILSKYMHSPTIVHMQVAKRLLRYLAASTVLKCDNKATLAIAANRMMHERTKHVEIDCHYVRDMVKAGDIEPQYVSSSSQVADIFTKILSSNNTMDFYSSWESHLHLPLSLRRVRTYEVVYKESLKAEQQCLQVRKFLKGVQWFVVGVQKLL
uniref:Uncharacterized protein n=1 Tax=Chenopodium quinoa TaxID=63459 RepID=A0A803NAS2_CHEQI